MQAIKEFGQVVDMLANRGTRKKVAVVWAQDPSTREAVAMAIEQGFAEAIFVGCRAEIEADERYKPLAAHYSVIEASDPDDAAAKAVQMVREGKADLMMKGMINTDNLLRAVLNKQTGILPAGATLLHVTIAQIPSYDKLLLFTDAAVLPYPNDAQRMAQVKALTEMLHGLGVAKPKIALVHCSEKIDPKHFPFTENYGELSRMSAAGELGECIVDGPMDVKTACSLAAMKKKGLSSPIEGSADAIIFPDIEAGNSFYKTLTLFAGANTAGVLKGLDVPVVVSSRGDSTTSKFYSLAMASI